MGDLRWLLLFWCFFLVVVDEDVEVEEGGEKEESEEIMVARFEGMPVERVHVEETLVGCENFQ